MLDEVVDGLDSGAIFSPCRRWRYLLWRRWDPELSVCNFIGLNPSTADEQADDPTIRRCIRFAADWGYGAVHMTNIFAFRATDPKVMMAAGSNAVGPRNNEYLLHTARAAELVIAAWGVGGGHLDREGHVIRMCAQTRIDLHALALSKDGHPRHPLYLRADLKPASYVTSYYGVPVIGVLPETPLEVVARRGVPL